MRHILEELVENSQRAINDGVYDIRDSLEKSGTNLPQAIKNAPHAALITEIKFSSPSAGTIRAASAPAHIAESMVAGGACALSVLTQPYLFGGSPEYFMQVRSTVNVPMLMKDIIIDKIQIDAARTMGADCILLIQSLFDGERLDKYIRYGHKMGLDILLEVHTAKEFACALDTDADIIGINNRNLDTLEVDTDTTGRILAGYDGQRHIISESGIDTAQDVMALRDAGACGFLVGSSIMKSNNIKDAVKALVNAY